MADGTPTADAFFGGANPADAAAPTAAAFFAPPAPPTPPPQAGAAFDTIWSNLESSGAKVLNAAGQGFQQAWGAKPVGLSDEAQEGLRKAGLFNDYQRGHESLFKSFNESVMRSSAAAADVAMRAPAAVAAGLGAGATETGAQIEGGNAPTQAQSLAAYPAKAAGELLTGASEGAFGGEIGGEPLGAGVGELAGRVREAQTTQLSDALKARSTGTFGEGEAGYYDAMPLSAENAEARVSAATEAGEPPLPAEAPAPDVHALARRIDPETFQEYDALNAEAAIHRDTVARLSLDRETSPEVVQAQTDISTILGKVNGVESRLTKAAAGRLEDAQGRLDTALGTDTPEMAEARARLMDADFAMRDLAEPVSAAYRQAREMAPDLPITAPIETPKPGVPGEEPEGAQPETPEAQGQQQAEAAQAATDARAEGQPAEQRVAPVAADAEGEAAGTPPNVVGDETLGEPAATAQPAPAGRAVGNPKAVAGTGETVTRGLSREVEASAIENELTDSFGDLPEYNRLNMKDQAAKAVQFMDRDYDAAKSVAMGTRTPPAGLHPASVLVGVEKRATAEGDVATLQQLANSPFATRVTTAAQTIRIMGERDKASPLGALQEVQQAREAHFAQTTGDLTAAKADTVAEMRAEIKAQAKSSKVDAWSDFLSSIECGE